MTRYPNPVTTIGLDVTTGQGYRVASSTLVRRSRLTRQNIAFTQCQPVSKRLSYVQAADVERLARILDLVRRATGFNPQYKIAMLAPPWPNAAVDYRL